MNSEIAAKLHHPYHAFDKPNATDVLIDHWEEVSKNWGPGTQKEHISLLDEVILPVFSRKPLEAFTSKEDYENIIKEIQMRGKRRPGAKTDYSPATLEKYRSIMRRILSVASDNRICMNVLWGTTFSVPKNIDPDKEQEEVRNRLRKSLMPKEEYALAEMVFSDYLQPGEDMFALLAWTLGGRPSEVADIQWSNVRLYGSRKKNRYVIAVLTTVYKKGSKPGGKNKNMYRFIPISPKLAKFLLDRKLVIEEEFQRLKKLDSPPDYIKDIDSIDELFICCNGNNYFERCDVRKARNMCRDRLRSIGIEESIFRYFEKEAAKSNDLSVWGEEKSVTSYILRRNFCTMLHNMDLDADEILYLMGHSMRGLSKRRSDLRYSLYMDAMWEKMTFRPIFNPPPDWDALALVSEGEHVSKTEHNTPQKNAIIKNVKTGGELVIQVTPNEANDPIYIDLEVISEDGSIIPIHGVYQTTLARGTQKKSVNILSDLLHMYSYGLKPRKDTGEKDNAASEGESQADSLKG